MVLTEEKIGGTNIHSLRLLLLMLPLLPVQLSLSTI